MYLTTVRTLALSEKWKHRDTERGIQIAQLIVKKAVLKEKL